MTVSMEKRSSLMIEKILQLREFQEQPPVLVDVGASKELHSAWKQIAPFSICVGFDADKRATEFTVSENQGYKSLYVIHKLIGTQNETVPFFLTESPYCSSTLEPDLSSLSRYNFKNLFRVKNTIDLPAIDLKSALKALELDYVDWFKTDSQGTDLRVFKSLGKTLISNVFVAEFEPGIMDAYKDEDKMHEIMAFMQSHQFWLFDLKLHGPVRISQEDLHRHFSLVVRESIDLVHRQIPFWGEMSYFPEMNSGGTKRRFLFGCACALIFKQYGFCIELAQKGLKIHGDLIFEEIKRHAISQIKRNCSFHSHLRALWRIMKRWFPFWGRANLGEDWVFTSWTFLR